MPRENLPESALIVCYFLARWDESSYKWLYAKWNVHTQRAVHEKIANILGRKSTSIKLLRDEFDAFFPNTRRKGWWNRPPIKNREEIYNAYKKHSEQDLRVIVARILSLDSEPPDVDDIEKENSEISKENKKLKMHRVRERNREIVERKKQQILDATGSLECEGCGFNFKDIYGDHGDGFIECHHTKPISEMKPSGTTTLNDLVLVCSNCHRMIHRKRVEPLSMDQLRELVECNK